ncbi:retropepsin-like aspartic protease [Fagus crenata]
MASYERRQSLLKLLNRIQIPTNITPEALVRMMGLVQSSVAIIFTNKDLPHQGHRHLQALHITFDTIEKMVLMVLINNGSALIACPLKTTSCLGIKGSRIVPSKQSVRAYDNTRREVLGIVELQVVIGPIEQKVEFQVIDIPSIFNMF